MYAFRPGPVKEPAREAEYLMTLALLLEGWPFSGEWSGTNIEAATELELIVDGEHVLWSKVDSGYMDRLANQGTIIVLKQDVSF
jgi:hypothetical protein